MGFKGVGYAFFIGLLFIVYVDGRVLGFVQIVSISNRENLFYASDLIFFTCCSRVQEYPACTSSLVDDVGKIWYNAKHRDAKCLYQCINIL